MKKILPLLLVLLLGCTDTVTPTSELTKYTIEITSNYTSPVDQSSQWYEPVDWENHQCDTLPTIHFNDLQPDFPLTIVMGLWSFCSNEVVLRVWEKPDSAGNRKLILTKKLFGTGEDLTVTVP